jgi:hypothetical protein
MAFFTTGGGGSAIPGLPGQDGREVELQVAGGYVQWRYAGSGDPWADLVALSDITGPAGATGQQGAAGTVTIDSVTTGAPGTNASVTNTGTASAAILRFTIPRGDKGVAGQDGSDGAAASVSVGDVTTGAAGSGASVSNTGTSSAAVLDFVIPRGADGSDGTNGSDGDDGREVEVGVDSGYICWRYVGDTSWSQLVSLASLKGADGTDGVDGQDGDDGAPGPNEVSSATDTDFANGSLLGASGGKVVAVAQSTFAAASDTYSKGNVDDFIAGAKGLS